MTPCSTNSPWKTLSRTGAIVVVFGLGLASNGAAFAATDGPSTVRAVIGGDGKVTSVSRLGGDTNNKPNAEDIPVSLSIEASEADGARTTTYTVENKTTKSEPVSIAQPDGSTKTVQQDVQTPYVAQLYVSLPASLTDVTAPGAGIVTNSDGSHELTFSMVLFAPVGSPTATVSYTAKGNGNPVARLETMAVSANSTPGLSSTSQDANTKIAENGTLNAVASGANGGLTKLSAGVSQIIAGLDKLHAGLVPAGPGSQKLAKGTHDAKDGSAQLADGANKLFAGSGQLLAGLQKADTGTVKIADGVSQLLAGSGQLVTGLQTADAGSNKLTDGSQALATGAGLTDAGAQSLSTGLQQISAGLGQLAGVDGLPAALAGAELLRAGVLKISAGLGSPTTDGTILNGLAKVGAGLTDVKGGLDALVAPDGVPAAKAGADQLKAAVDGLILPGVNQVQAGLADGAKTGGGIDQLKSIFQAAAAKAGCAPSAPTTPTATTTSCQDLNTGIYQIDHNPSSADPTAGLKQQTQAGADGLSQVAAGLKSGDANNPGVSEGLAGISAGLAKAIAGLNALDAGVGTPAADGTLRNGVALVNGGVLSVAAGVRSNDTANPGLYEGLNTLITGLTAAVTGVTQLNGGAAQAAAGSVTLADGTHQVAAGAGQIAEGQVQLTDGLDQLLAGGVKINGGLGLLAPGTTELKDGLDQLLAGGQQINVGLGQLSPGAVKLDAGLAQLAAGQDQVAAGLPAAIDGSAQLLAGSQQVGTGLHDVKAQATDVLANQLATGTEQASVTLGTLAATDARLTADPSIATTTYVLTQEAGDLKSAKTTASDGGSNTGRNLGLAAGGLLAVAVGAGAGFAGGRRKTV